MSLVASIEQNCKQGRRIFLIVDKKPFIVERTQKREKKNNFCEACEKNINFISKYSHIESTAHEKKNKKFGMNKDRTHRKNNFDDPHLYQLQNIVKETIEDYMQIFIQSKRNVKTK